MLKSYFPMLEREMPPSLDDAVPQRLFRPIHLAVVAAASAAGRQYPHILLGNAGANSDNIVSKP